MKGEEFCCCFNSVIWQALPWGERPPYPDASWHLKSSIGQYKRLELLCQSYSLQAEHQQQQQAWACPEMLIGMLQIVQT